MKGKRSFKRFLAVVMAVVFTVTGITFTPKDARAADSGTISNNDTWTAMATDGWSYKAKNTVGADATWSYASDCSLSDTLSFNVTKGGWVEADFEVKTPTYTAASAGAYTVTFTNVEAANTSSTYLRVYKSDGTLLETSSNINIGQAGGSPSNPYTAVYTVTVNLAASDAIYADYVEDYSGAGTRSMSCTITRTGDISTAADTPPDLTTVISQTPSINDSSWDQFFGGNGATIANTVDSNGNTYYIPTTFEWDGQYNTFFNGNNNVYGIYANGAAVPWSGCPAGQLTSDAYGINSNRISGSKIGSIWVGTTKLASSQWYNNGGDVIAIDASNFALAANEDAKIFYVTVRDKSGTDYSWPIKVVKAQTPTTTTTTTAAPTTTTAAPTTTAPQDGYNTCITQAESSNLQDIGNNWQYQVGQSAGYRYGTFDGVTYLAEMKNRYSNSNTMYLYTPSGFKSLTNGTEYNVEITFHSTGTVPVNMVSYYSSAMPNILLGNVTSGNTTLRTSFTATDDFSGRYQIILTGVPAGVEVGITNLTITEATSSPVDAVSGTATGGVNSISCSWTEGTGIPTGQKYQLFVDDVATGSLINSVGDSEEITQNLTGISAGSHTVKVKATLDDGSTYSTGYTLGTTTVYDPNPVAPASVSAVDSATKGEAIDVSFVAGASPVTGQTYKVYIDDVLVGTETAPGTYTYDATVDVAHTVKVSGYLATAATPESSKTAAAGTVTPTWHRAIDSTWSSAIDGWQFQLYGAYGNSQAMDYKGTTGSDNMQVRVDASSGDATGGHYAIQMKKALSDLYSGLTAGVTYTMTMTADSSVNGGGVYVQGIGNNEEFDISNSVLTIEKSVTIPASPSGDMKILLDGLTAGTVLSNFDVTFTPTTVPVVNPATVTGAATANNDEIEVSWTAGTGALSTTVYDIYLDDDASPRATNVSISSSPVTISNLPASYRGTGHTVKVVPKVTEGGTTYTNTGTISSSFMIKGPIAIDSFHDGVTATTISIYWDDPANMCSGQQYNVYVDGVKTADSPMSAPTSSSPYVIENLTTDQSYTVMVKAVYNNEESSGVSKAITPKSVDPSWTATTSGYSWYRGGMGLGTYDSPNLYYKLGDANGDTDNAWMSFMNINSEATNIRILSSAFVGRLNTTANYTITLNFTSDTADSTGGTWKHGLDNAATLKELSSAKTIASGNNTYTETFSQTIGATYATQNLNGFFDIEIPAGATIEIKSFTITSDDSLNPYKSMIQDAAWHTAVPSDPNENAKWHYNLYVNGYNNGSMGYYNAENYGETSTGANDGFHFYNNRHRRSAVNIATGDLMDEFNMEDGRLYDVSLKITGRNDSSSTQRLYLERKPSIDGAEYEIDHQDFTANDTTQNTFTGQIWGDDDGIFLEILSSGGMQAGDYRVDELSITPAHSGEHAVGDGGWHQSKVNGGAANGLWYYKLPESTSSNKYSAVYTGSGADSSGSYTGLSVTNESTTNTTLRWATQDLKTKYSLTAGKAYTATVTLNVNNRTNLAGTAGLYKKTSATSESQSMFATGQTIAASTDNQTITLTGPIQVNSSACCLEVVINNAYDLDFTVTNITFTALDGKAMNIPSVNWERTELNSSSSAGKWYYYCATFGNDEKVVTYKNADNYGASSNGFTYKAYSPYDHSLRLATQDLVSDYSLSAGKRYTVTMVVDATNTDSTDRTITLRRKASPTADAATSIQTRTVEANTTDQELTFTGTVDLSSAALSLELFSNLVNDLEVKVKSLTIVEATGNVADTDGTWHQSALNDGTVSGRWWYKYDETSADASGFYKDASASTYDGFTFTNEEAIISTDGKGLLLSTGNIASQYNLVNGATYKAVVHTTVDNYDDSTGAIGLNVKTAGPDSDTGRAMISDHFTYAAAATSNQSIDLSGAFTVSNNAAYLEVELGGLEGPGEDPQTINAMKVTIDSIEFYPGAHTDNDWHTCTNVDGSTTGSKWHYRDYHPDNWHIADSYANANQYEGFTWDNSVYSNGHVFFATTNLAAASAYNLADGKYNATVVLTATGSNNSGHMANTPITINVKDSTESDDHSHMLAPTQNLTYTMDETEMTFTGPVTVSNGELYLEVQMGEPKEVSKLVVTDISFDEWIPVVYGAEPVTVGDSKLWLGNDESGNHYNFSYHNSSTGYSNLRAKITQNDAADLSTAADGYAMQVKVPNNVVYTSANNSGDALVAGATYTMTVSYTTTAAGYMRINTEGYTPYPAKQHATAAGNYTITYDFVYDPAQTTQSKYVVLMLQGFPENAIISGIDFAITGGVKPAVGASAARINRTQGTISWSDPVGMNQFYNVYINGSSTPTLSSVRAGTHTLSNIPDTAASDYTISIKATRGGDESSAVTATIGDWITGTTTNDWVDVGDYGYKFEAGYNGEYCYTYNGNAFAIKDLSGGPEWQWGAYYVGSSATTVVPGEQYAFSITLNRSDSEELSDRQISLHMDGGTFDATGTSALANVTVDSGEDYTYSGTFTAGSDSTVVRLYGVYQNPQIDEIFGIKNCEIVVPESLTLRNTGSAVAIELPDGATSSYTVTYVSNGQTVTGETVTAAEVTAGEHTLAAFPDNKAKVYVKDGSGHVEGVAVAEADFVVNEIKVNYDYSTGTQKQIHANTNNTVYVTVANIGTARGTAPAGYYQDFGVKAEQGNWFNTDWAFGWGEGYSYPIIVDPNGTHRFSVYGWRPVEIGNYTITATVNHEEYIPESNYGNNTRSASFTTTAQLTDSTAVLGFQLNTDTSGPSYFNPSFRTVCRALKVVDVDGQMKNITGYGFVYAKTDDAAMTNLKGEMTVANASKFTKKDGTVIDNPDGNQFINAYEARETVDLSGYTTHGSTYNSENSVFYALTFKDLYYTTKNYEQQYTFRSYLTYTDNNGQTQYVYPNDIYTTSLYEIAEDLYKYRKMKTQDAHNFLYDYILNIIAMRDNYKSITTGIMAALGVTKQNRGTAPYSDYYAMANMNYKDMYYYAMCTNGYGYKSGNMVYDETAPPYTDDKLVLRAVIPYTHDYPFQSKQIDDSGTYTNEQFLGLLNTATATSYNTVPDWIRGCIGKNVNGKDLTSYAGMYPKVSYDWDSNLDKDYGKQ